MAKAFRHNDACPEIGEYSFNIASIAGLVGIADRVALQRIEAWGDRHDADTRRRVGADTGVRCNAICSGMG
jgi:hypothetical protein